MNATTCRRNRSPRAHPGLHPTTSEMHRRWLFVWIFILWGAGLPSYGQTQIPRTFVLPSSAADASQPGFIWRVHQVDGWQPNENSRTEKQLAGLLGVNLANPNAVGAAIAPAAPANPPTAPIEFN